MNRITALLCGMVAAAASLAAQPAVRPVDDKTLLAESLAATLDAYRLFRDERGRAPNDGVTPYTLNTPLFSDYAEKFRYVYLPPGQGATYAAPGAFEFPVGATLIKTFAYPADFRKPDENVRFLETRLLIRKQKGWVALTYVWNAEQTRAVLQRAGQRIDVSFVDAKGETRHVDYGVPNVNQCKECHGLNSEITPLGPKARNLNGDYVYAEGAENQLTHWARIGILKGAPDAKDAPRAAHWDDASEPLEARARAYFDVNCAHCHNPGGSASNSGLFLGADETNPAALGFGKHPVAAGRGAGGLEVAIAPGHPDQSIIAFRMASTEPGIAMPEVGRTLVHEEGLALVREYIASLPPADAK